MSRIAKLEQWKVTAKILEKAKTPQNTMDSKNKQKNKKSPNKEMGNWTNQPKVPTQETNH